MPPTKKTKTVRGTEIEERYGGHAHRLRHPSRGGRNAHHAAALSLKEQVVSRAIDGLDLNSYPPSMLSGRATAAGRRQWPGSDRHGATRRVPLRRQPRDLQRRLRRAGGDPYMAADFCRAIMTGSRPNGSRRTTGCGPRSWCRSRRRILRSRRSSAAPAIIGSSRYCCPRRTRRCSGGGITGRSTRPPRSTNCRSRSTPAAPIAARRARSAGRPIATNIIWPRRRRSRRRP